MRTIDPIQSLAFAIQSHPGIYALLLGSGVSSAAGIPTGWQIVLDLIRRLAVANNESAEPDPEQWYLNKYNESPDYSKLLDVLAQTPTERQQLLCPYFEPTDGEREEGLKQPTEAHRAIAYLASQGFVRVIVTTNFDRLIERALEDEGVAPEVISTPGQLDGSLPLTHVKCRVLKLHGDYLDPKILNTPEELANYSEETNEHLDRIFDEFGLVVCGWSGEWDIALRDAIDRSPSKRFTTFWASRGQPTGAAQRLIERRQAVLVPIDGADDFFRKTRETVESLLEFSRPHPLSTEAAVASLKRYLPSHEHRIRLSDLIDATVEQLVNDTSGEEFKVERMPQPTREEISKRLRRHEIASSTLLAMAPIGGSWAEDYHYPAWGRALQRLGTPPRVSQWYQEWLSTAIHPARLLLYAIGMGAVASGCLSFLSRLFNTPVKDGPTSTGAVPILSALFDVKHTTSPDWNQFLEGMNRSISPLSDWIHDSLRDHLRPLIPDDDRYTYVFDKLEVLFSLGYAHLDRHSGRNTWFPPGAFLYREENRKQLIAEFTASISEDEADSPLVRCGILRWTRKTGQLVKWESCS